MSEKTIDHSEPIDNTTSLVVSLHDSYPPQEIDREELLKSHSSENYHYKMYGVLQKKVATMQKILNQEDITQAEKTQQLKLCMMSIDFSKFNQHSIQQSILMPTQKDIDLLASTRQIRYYEKIIAELTQETSYYKRNFEELTQLSKQKDKKIEEITQQKENIELEMSYLKSEIEKLRTVEIQIMHDSLTEELTKIQKKRSELNQMDDLYKDQIKVLQEEKSQLSQRYELLLQDSNMKSKEQEQQKWKSQELLKDQQIKNSQLLNQLQNMKQNTVSLQLYHKEQNDNKILLEEIFKITQQIFTKDVNLEDLNAQILRLEEANHQIRDQNLQLDKKIQKIIEQRQTADFQYKQTIQALTQDLNRQTYFQSQLLNKLQKAQNILDRQQLANKSMKLEMQYMRMKYNADCEKMAKDEVKIKTLQSQVIELTKEREDRQNILQEVEEAAKMAAHFKQIIMAMMIESNKLQEQKEQMREYFTKKILEQDKIIEQFEKQYEKNEKIQSQAGKQHEKNEKIKSQAGKFTQVQELFRTLKKHFSSLPTKKQRQKRRQHIKLFLAQYQ